MKSCWKILGINPTEDKAEIKKAFAALVKIYPPSKDPEKYQKIREAYDEAMKISPEKNPDFQDATFTFEKKISRKEEKSPAHDILDEAEEQIETDEATERIKHLREEVFNKGSVENLRHEAIKKERGKFIVLVIIFIPISLIMIYRSQKYYGGMPCVLFNLLFGFVVASLSGKFDGKHSRTGKLDQQKISVGKEQIIGENISVSLIFRFLMTLVLCIIFKIIVILTDVPLYMHHFFGGVLFFYFVYNIHHLNKILSRKANHKENR